MMFSAEVLHDRDVFMRYGWIEAIGEIECLRGTSSMKHCFPSWSASSRMMHNFLVHYRQLADVWTLFDNSGQVPRVVALERNKRVRIMRKGVYTALVNRHGRT